MPCGCMSGLAKAPKRKAAPRKRSSLKGLGALAKGSTCTTKRSSATRKKVVCVKTKVVPVQVCGGFSQPKKARKTTKKAAPAKRKTTARKRTARK